MPKADIPSVLGDCRVLKEHDDGDLTLDCQGSRFVATTEGEVFAQVDLRHLERWLESKEGKSLCCKLAGLAGKTGKAGRTIAGTVPDPNVQGVLAAMNALGLKSMPEILAKRMAKTCKCEEK